MVSNSKRNNYAALAIAASMAAATPFAAHGASAPQTTSPSTKLVANTSVVTHGGFERYEFQHVAPDTSVVGQVLKTANAAPKSGTFQITAEDGMILATDTNGTLTMNPSAIKAEGGLHTTQCKVPVNMQNVTTTGIPEFMASKPIPANSFVGKMMDASAAVPKGAECTFIVGDGSSPDGHKIGFKGKDGFVMPYAAQIDKLARDNARPQSGAKVQARPLPRRLGAPQT